MLVAHEILLLLWTVCPFIIKYDFYDYHYFFYIGDYNTCCSRVCKLPACEKYVRLSHNYLFCAFLAFNCDILRNVILFSIRKVLHKNDLYD
jgi:hypothetical protein